MGTIMGAKDQMYEQDLETNTDFAGFYGDSSKRGKIIVRVEPVQKSNFHARFKMVWRKLNNRRRFSCFNKWEQVRFEIGRNIPGTTNFVTIYSSTHYLR